MRLNRFAFSALALLLGATLPALKQASAQPGYGYNQDRDHDRDDAPREWNDIQRKGFHDGMTGAQRDWDNHRNPNPENRDEFRDVDLPRDQAELYREGFRRGYNVAAARLWGSNYNMQQGPPPGAYNQGGYPGGNNWGPPPDQFSALQRQGYQDGLIGAQRDWDPTCRRASSRPIVRASSAATPSQPPASGAHKSHPLRRRSCGTPFPTASLTFSSAASRTA